MKLVGDYESDKSLVLLEVVEGVRSFAYSVCIDRNEIKYSSLGVQNKRNTTFMFSTIWLIQKIENKVIFVGFVEALLVYATFFVVDIKTSEFEEIPGKREACLGFKPKALYQIDDAFLAGDLYNKVMMFTVRTKEDAEESTSLFRQSKNQNRLNSQK